MTPRERLYALVEANATPRRSVTAIYSRLYDAFEEATNTNWRRMAYNAETTTLDYIEQRGELPSLLLLAQKTLVQKPALPEKEKAPVQGSLLEGGLL